jgi:glyoxylase-like metal-dependent hydrolase (beta-lactamase superfamily II)
VDALMTVREATALADWIELHDRRLTTIYITHGHGDHYSGLPVVLGRFPDARAVATAGTVEQMRNGSATAHPYRAWFPGQIADKIPLAEPLDAGHFELEGLAIEVIGTGAAVGVEDGGTSATSRIITARGQLSPAGLSSNTFDSQLVTFPR